MKQQIRAKVLNDPLLRRNHIHPDKPIKVDSLIYNGIMEYEDYGDDLSNRQTIQFERRKPKKQFN